MAGSDAPARPALTFLLAVLLEVDVPCFTIAPFESYSPRAIDAQAVAARVPMQGMQPETRNIQVRACERLLKGVELASGAVFEMVSYLGRVVLLFVSSVSITAARSATPRCRA